MYISMIGIYFSQNNCLIGMYFWIILLYIQEGCIFLKTP